jgi:hypothetical protein
MCEAAHPPSENAAKMALAAVTLRCRLGVAQSQVMMGRWTPEFYDQRTRQYQKEFIDAFREIYPGPAK